MKQETKKPGFLLSLTPIIILVGLLALGVFYFGEDFTSGPSQIAIMFCCMITCATGLWYLKIPWQQFEEAMGDNIKTTTGAIMILLSIGALTASWMHSGVVPTMVYYGLKLISPKVFLFVSFLLCGLVSVLAGSSWTTVGTVGVALFGAGQMVGLPSGWLAGAIISGAYMGDKISPLSDTTNLSSSVAGADLYTHVKYTVQTTVPAFVICAVVYLIVGFTIPVQAEISVGTQLEAIEGTFNISLWLLIIPAITIFLIYKKIPAFITLFVSAVASAVTAFVAQPQIVAQIAGGTTGIKAFYFTIFKMLGSSVTIDTGDPLISSLTSTGGMGGMVNTVWIIICVMVLGGSLSACGMLQTITEKIIKLARGTTGMVSATVFSCIISNIIMSDQYMGIVLPGKMFKDAYRKKKLAPELLSRTLQDSATVSSVLVPWNTCAVVQSSVLGIATIKYLPYATFCLITPFIAIILAAAGYKMHRLSDEETADDGGQIQAPTNS